MIEPNIMDHVLALIILVAIPAYGYVTFPAVKRKLAADPPGIRVRLYRRTMTWQWSLTAITIVAWLGAGRSLAALGLAWPHGTGGWIALAIAAAVIGLMSAQLRALPQHRDVHDAVREQLEGAAPFLPRDRHEHTWFTGVALTAGICEELLFRGFCLAYVGQWTGPLTAVALTSLMFGLGHLYQGPQGAVKTGIAGLIAGGVFVLGGSLWLPIVMHAFVDVHGGLVYRVVRPRRTRGRGAAVGRSLGSAALRRRCT